MTEKKQTVAERLEELKRQQEAAKSQNIHQKEELIEQLTHESDGSPDFSGRRFSNIGCSGRLE